MWFDGVRQPNTIYVADISHGKDSTAMLRAIQILGFPLDVICTTDMWATKDIRAELPPMVQFKDEWDRKCQEYFGLPVTHVCAHKRERETAEDSHTSHTKNTSIERDVPVSSQDLQLGSQCRAMVGVGNSSTNRLTYEDLFYRHSKACKAVVTGKNIRGFPTMRTNWCNSDLKRNPCRCSGMWSAI